MKFRNRFVTLLEQDDEQIIDPTLSASPEDERNAMAGTLDKNATPADYDVPAPMPKSDVEKQRQVAELKNWISEIDNFIEMLNAPKPTSMQSKLHSAQCDTMFDDIARSEKKKIARLAAELSALSESLKGYLISSNT